MQIHVGNNKNIILIFNIVVKENVNVDRARAVSDGGEVAAEVGFDGFDGGEEVAGRQIRVGLVEEERGEER